MTGTTDTEAPPGGGTPSPDPSNGTGGNTSQNTDSQRDPLPSGDAPKTDDKPEFKVPDAYKEKPWAAKIKSEEDLYKQIDNLDKLAGKKAVVPDFTKATEQEKSEFYGQIRPADKAEFGKALSLSEDIPEADRSLYTELMHETGATVETSKKIIEKFTAAVEAQKMAMTTKQGFEQEMTKSFGDDYKSIAGRAATSMKEHLSEGDQKIVEGMPNSYLGVMYRLQHAMIEAYGANETDKASARGGNMRTSEAEINSQIREVRDKMSKLSTQPHTQQQKDELQNSLDNLYTKKARL